MSYQIVQASAAAMEKKEQAERSSYPFAELAVGQSFLVPIADVTEVNLRMAVSRQNKKKDGKRFTVVKHGDPHNVFEVARTA